MAYPTDRQNDYRCFGTRRWKPACADCDKRVACAAIRTHDRSQRDRDYRDPANNAAQLIIEVGNQSPARRAATLLKREDSVYKSIGLGEGWEDVVIERIDAEAEIKSIDERRAAMIVLYAAGRTQEEIAAHFGISQPRVKAILREFGKKE